MHLLFPIMCLHIASTSGRYIGNYVSDTPKNNTCHTKGCLDIATTIGRNVNPNVDPCEDFYEYACGSFVRNNRIPEDKSSISSFTEIDDKVQNRLRVLLEQPDTPNSPRIIRMMKDFYASCMDTGRLEGRGTTPIMQVLDRLGGWPVLLGEKWDEKSFSWESLVPKMLKEGFNINIFFMIHPRTGYKDAKRKYITIDEPQLCLVRNYLVRGLENKQVIEYLKFMVDVAIALGANYEKAISELADALKLEMEIAMFMLPIEEKRNYTRFHNPMTIDELQQRFHTINWLPLINNYLYPHHVVNGSEIIVVRNPAYLHNVEQLVLITPKRSQANLIMWKTVESTLQMLTENLRKRQMDYIALHTGLRTYPPRWKQCILLPYPLNLVLNGDYVYTYFRNDAKEKATQMFESIYEVLKNTLKGLNWMDNETKQHALEKAQSISKLIGYPNELIDCKKLSEFLEPVEFDRNLLFESQLKLRMFARNLDIKRFREPVNKTEWIKYTRVVEANAYAHWQYNIIEITAAILQSPFFSEDRPNYLNFGAIGSIIGHELTHLYDDQGSQFDKDGNLVDWWSPSSKAEFLKKAKCIIDQYANYTSPEINMKLNGINTQGENIADNIGVKLAYIAYNSWVKQHGEELQLPGLNYTPQQLFWLSLANIWCVVTRPEKLKSNILNSYHSPDRFRVIGPLSNIKYFAQDFSCKVGSKMNPVNRCCVW